MEQWLDVVIAPEFYEVSDMGRVRRKKQCPGARKNHILKPVKNQGGYLAVNLSMGSRTQRMRVRIHVLVLEAFIGKRPDKEVSNHKDGNKTNNALTNLEWVSISYNTWHAYHVLKSISTSGVKNGQSKHIDAAKLSVLRSQGLTQLESAKALGISRELVNRFENNRHWSQRPV